MTGSPDIVVTAVAAALLVAGARGHYLLMRERRRLTDLQAESKQLQVSRTSLRRERQRVRRSHREKRRAQRVLGMVRALVGCRDATELARRASGTLVDGFAVRGAAVWSADEIPVLLGEAGAVDVVGQTPWSGDDGGGDDPGRRRLVLRDEERRPVAQLLIDLGDRQDLPAGLPAYAAVLGALLGAADLPVDAGGGADATSEEILQESRTAVEVHPPPG